MTLSQITVKSLVLVSSQDLHDLFKRLQQILLFICSWFPDAPCCRTETQWLSLLGSAPGLLGSATNNGNWLIQSIDINKRQSFLVISWKIRNPQEFPEVVSSDLERPRSRNCSANPSKHSWNDSPAGRFKHKSQHISYIYIYISCESVVLCFKAKSEVPHASTLCTLW